MGLNVQCTFSKKDLRMVLDQGPGPLRGSSFRFEPAKVKPN